MKNKAPLALMEQLVMILVFALTAALCLQIFVFSNTLSVDGETRDHAVCAVQNAAEAIKLCAGDYEAMTAVHGGETEEDGWRIGYDENWQAVPAAQASYTVEAKSVKTEQPLLGSAQVTARSASGRELFEVTVCWQEGLDG